MVDDKISQLYVGNIVGRGRGPHYKIRSVPDLNYKDLIQPNRLLKITKHNSRIQIICMLLLVFLVKGANNIFIFQVALVSRRI